MSLEGTFLKGRALKLASDLSFHFAEWEINLHLLALGHGVDGIIFDKDTSQNVCLNQDIYFDLRGQYQDLASKEPDSCFLEESSVAKIAEGLAQAAAAAAAASSSTGPEPVSKPAVSSDTNEPGTCPDDEEESSHKLKLYQLRQKMGIYKDPTLGSVCKLQSRIIVTHPPPAPSPTRVNLQKSLKTMSDLKVNELMQTLQLRLNFFESEYRRYRTALGLICLGLSSADIYSIRGLDPNGAFRVLKRIYHGTALLKQTIWDSTKVHCENTTLSLETPRRTRRCS